MKRRRKRRRDQEVNCTSSHNFWLRRKRLLSFFSVCSSTPFCSGVGLQSFSLYFLAILVFLSWNLLSRFLNHRFLGERKVHVPFTTHSSTNTWWVSLRMRLVIWKEIALYQTVFSQERRVSWLQIYLIFEGLPVVDFIVPLLHLKKLKLRYTFLLVTSSKIENLFLKNFGDKPFVTGMLFASRDHRTIQSLGYMFTFFVEEDKEKYSEMWLKILDFNRKSINFWLNLTPILESTG